MKVISACLIGCECRYDQKSCLDSELEQLLREGKAIPVCPEQLGGLPTPRPPAEIVGGDGYDVLDGRAKIIDNTGRDVTAEFLAGAQQALRLATTVGATSAILKENSPSCGSSFVYDGQFSGKKVSGIGLTAALFRRNGIEVQSERD
ncbi:MULTISPECIES: DUF523 domain-containing protein [Brevibacillus]|uniref:Purine-nucleoside phosphorylase n=1 Tax=Brevibacillus parabrevis TaxID=54914 RepID=A0A4Y3P829_BREPA|nr:MULTISPECIES: DUF523 domain-containing protein [Brevibacillus]NRQ52708.1 DUF523 domain-containing protein [Brevibacillus sp. HD1.4A]TGV24925.1 DUF523 domain-containing protein [Mesorhizobium sp. M00.F.Ca.ET.186.01.1.1]MBU8712683.1 DUF523 domain-containing protein [Brevibacillus parabrevis]RNB96548.1 DUF523 domain-containing protein [Brevibacillus parabrevis]UED70269.1 DUF523 domain-containing protein [Brevibacillus sp. HD3.3A]